MSITRDDIQGDDGMLDAYSSLGIVESNLSFLYDQAQAELKELLMIIMKENEEVQNYIWNDTYHFNEEDLGSVFEQAIEAEFSYSIDESFELFCGLMKSVKNEMIKMELKDNNKPIMLHLELINEWCNEEDKELLINYADATEQGTITRDILIPSDMPLHNLHYAIQKLFGWQNSHLRAFHLDEEDYNRLTGNRVNEWSELIGILFRGIFDEENDYFWDDDYMDGSIKTWLNKRLKGPYEYGGDNESYYVAKESFENLTYQFPEVDVYESFDQYYERTKDSKNKENDSRQIVRRAPILELTIEELRNSISFNSVFDELLERCEVREILGSKEDKLAEFSDFSNNTFGEINLPVTDKLIYNYDFGDNWVVEITKIDNYEENNSLEEAVNIVKDKYKPICIHKKGGYVMDDVGGMDGYTDFIRTIYTSKDVEERKSARNWANGMGWNSRKIKSEKML